MNRALVITIVAVSAVALALVWLPTTPAPLPSPELLTDIGVEVVASGLHVPWAMDFAPDGRMFFTERIGTIRVIENGNLREEPVFRTEVANIGQAGMLGLALDPDFHNNNFIYVYYTYADATGDLWNRVIRLIESDNIATEDRILIDKIPGAATHNGGRIKFGPDDKLYITTGDAGNPTSAQDLQSLAGKILRINPDSSIPDDNPFANSPVYSYGHRNPEGIAWHPETKEMFATEPGPVGNDEINLVKHGMNYGWPEEQCRVQVYMAPIVCYEVTIEPAGATFYSSDVLPYKNDFFFAALRGTHVERVVFDGSNVMMKEKLLEGFGRLRDIVEGPDGYLYIATSNRDGRAFPALDDDKILRISRAR